MNINAILTLIIIIIAIVGPVFAWVVRVERKLAEICKDVKFLRGHILKWNLREPRDTDEITT